MSRFLRVLGILDDGEDGDCVGKVIDVIILSIIIFCYLYCV